MTMEEDYISVHTGQVIDGAISAVINGRAGLQGIYVDGTELEPDNNNKVSIPLDNYYNKSSVNSLLSNKIDKTAISQVTGDSTTSIMSQDAVTTALNSKCTTSLYTATLLANGWSNSAPYTQTVNVVGILATDTPIVDIVLDQANAEEQSLSWLYVSTITTSDGAIIATCLESKPTINMQIQIRVIR